MTLCQCIKTREDAKQALDKFNIETNNYLGVDINHNFIKLAKESYPDHNFKQIRKINQN